MSASDLVHARARRSLLVVSVAAVLGTAATPAAARPLRLTSTETSFVVAVNETRARFSLRPLQVDLELQRAARSHSADMVQRNYFAHRNVLTRLLRFGARGPFVGENLGWSRTDGQELPRLIRMWLESPKHRAVLLRPGFARVGIGVVAAPFMGWRQAIVVTADFEGR